LDDPNRFIWLRGFADMTTRAQALHVFGGPFGKHREAANETMIDSDNVLLLRPADRPPGFRSITPNVKRRERRTIRGIGGGPITILRRNRNDLVDFFERAIQSE
jgi:hypothetical protein